MRAIIQTNQYSVIHAGNVSEIWGNGGGRTDKAYGSKIINMWDGIFHDKCLKSTIYNGSATVTTVRNVT